MQRGFRWGALGFAVLVAGCGGAQGGSSEGAQRGSAAASGAQGSGVASEGGVAGSASGASGNVSVAGRCTPIADYCVSQCLADLVLVENPTCVGDTPACASGYVLASSCPPRACGVTPDACCDSTTGVVTANPCGSDGHRPACADGASETAQREPECVPASLGVSDCSVLDGQACSGPAVSCQDWSAGEVSCKCHGAAANAGAWSCSRYVGP